MLDVSNSWKSPPFASIESTLALGTMSERNSRSSEDKAIGLRSLEPPFGREKRLRNRETADGAASSEGVSSRGLAEEAATTGRTIAAGAGVGVDEGKIVGEAVRSGSGTIDGLALSVPGRGMSIEVLFEVNTTEAAAGDAKRSGGRLSTAEEVAFRPKNDRRPPGFFPLLPIAGDCASTFFSTILQPGGVSSWIASGFDLTAISQSVDPLEVMK